MQSPDLGQPAVKLTTDGRYSISLYDKNYTCVEIVEKIDNEVIENN